MKPLLFLLSAHIYISIHAQTPQQNDLCPRYKKFMTAGADSLKINNKSGALNQFLAAQIAARECDIPTDKAKAAINAIYDEMKQEKERIGKLLTQVERSREDEKKQRKKAVEAEKNTQIAFSKANKLVNAFYFYDNKYALAFGTTERFTNKFYFIDTTGKQVTRLHHWAKADQFSEFGYAQVQDDFENVFLLDITGRTYRIAQHAPNVDISKFQGYDMRSRGKENLNAISGQKQLRILLAANNKIDRFGDYFSAPNLIYLDLSGNKFKSLPPEIISVDTLIRLRKLQILMLAKNELQSVEWIERLTELKYLDISHNKIKDLPEGIGELKSLEILKVGNNQLNNLPKGISNLNNLIRLDLNANKLDTLPAEIGKLTKLTRLDLSVNKLKNLPETIGDLSNLTFLDLRRNDISSLPSGINKLQNLLTLNADSNPLTQLPKEIKSLKRLRQLDVTFTSLEALPKEIGDLESLAILKAGENNLKKLPLEIGKLKNLTDLDLSDNKLDTLPKEIGNLQKLTTLNLSGNEFKTVPNIGKLKNLKSLDLSNNPDLTALPPDIDKLKNLETLDVSHTNVPTSEIHSLKQKLTKCHIEFDEPSTSASQ